MSSKKCGLRGEAPHQTKGAAALLCSCPWSHPKKRGGWLAKTSRGLWFSPHQRHKALFQEVCFPTPHTNHSWNPQRAAGSWKQGNGVPQGGSGRGPAAGEQLSCLRQCLTLVRNSRWWCPRDTEDRKVALRCLHNDSCPLTPSTWMVLTEQSPCGSWLGASSCAITPMTGERDIQWTADSRSY